MKRNVDKKDKAKFSVRIIFVIPAITFEPLKRLQEYAALALTDKTRL